MKNEIIILGFQPFSEKMYPHLFDFLNEFQKYFTVIYLDFDNRGWDLVEMRKIFEFSVNKIIHPGQLLLQRKKRKEYFKKIQEKKSLLQDKISENTFAIIGIDHTAINLISQVNTYNAKLIFWSYDIITPDTWYSKYKFIQEVIEKNKKIISKFDFIIIQDHRRSAILDFTINSHKLDKFYFPISLKNDDFSLSISLKKNNESEFKIINLLQIMFLPKQRGSEELLKEYQNLPENINLFFQRSNVDNFDNFVRKPTVFPLENRIDKMYENVSIANIGFICYEVEDLNHYFISFSSSQLVVFLKLGIPLIVFKTPDLQIFVKENEIGVGINKIEELNSAIVEIQKNYSKFSKNVRKLFETKFEISIYTQKLAEKILS